MNSQMVLRRRLGIGWNSFDQDNLAKYRMKQEIHDIHHIFDVVTPSIAQRGWVVVGKRLGLTEATLDDIKSNNPRARKVDLARKLLCVWDEHSERGGSISKLIKALRAEDLTDAADMIGHYVIVPKATSSVRRQQIQMKRERTRRMNQRLQAEARQPRVVLEPDEEVLDGSDAWAEVLKDCVPSPEEGEQPHGFKHLGRRERKPGEVHGRVQATRLGVQDLGVGPAKPTTEGKMLQNSKLRKLYQYYEEVLHKQVDYIRALSKLTNFQGAIIRGLFLGSLNMVIYCETSDGLRHVKNSYSNGSLLNAIKKVLKDQPLLTRIGISDIELSLTIADQDFEECERELKAKIAEDAPEDGEVPRPTTATCQSLGVPTGHAKLSEFKVKQYHVSLRNKLEDIQATCEYFFKRRKKGLASALDLVKPPYVDQVTTMAEVTSYKRKISDMFYGGGKWLQVVNEFVELVQAIGVACESVQTNIKEMEFHFEKGNLPELLIDMERMTENITTKLDPKFDLGQLPVSQMARATDPACYAPLFVWVNSLVIDLEQVDHTLVLLWKKVSSA